ncbi:MAG: 3-isopropylmalate dehydratase small subunit [Chloroflexi bacterium]|nr:3-isopropylmalate dehydratase small subunit [Chloroflexota bacterium]
MIKGKVWKFGENVDTGQLAPPVAGDLVDAAIGARYCLVNIRPEFAKTVQRGDIIVAGKNFGCGSSRESAPKNLLALGVACVIAPSFGRIFLRNAINLGLPLLECAGAPDVIKEGDMVEADLASGRIADITRGRDMRASPLPPVLMEIIEKGGLMEYARAKLQARRIKS